MRSVVDKNVEITPSERSHVDYIDNDSCAFIFLNIYQQPGTSFLT